MAYGGPGRPADKMLAAMLEALFTSSPVGLHLLDTDLRVVRLNTATSGMRGVQVEDMVGRPVRDVYQVVEDSDMETVLHHVLETGEPLWQRIVRAQIKGERPEERHFEVTAMRLEKQGPQPEVLGLAVTVVDVTERERGRVRSGVLDAVRRRVGRALDPSVTGEELVAALVPDFADIAIVEVVDSVIRGDEPPPAPLPPGTALMRTAFRSGQAHPPQAHPVGEVRRLPGPTPFTQALADLCPRVVPLHAPSPWMDIDPPRAEAMHSSKSHTLLVVPLALRDAALGLVSLYRTGQSPPFDTGDRQLAVELAAHTALAIDNARRYIREHTIAATVQRQLLPRRPETHPSLETAYLSVSGVDPGAWYDTITLSSARTALVIGNVSGRGPNAAAGMGQLRTVVRSLAAFDLPPGRAPGPAARHSCRTRLRAGESAALRSPPAGGTDRRLRVRRSRPPDRHLRHGDGRVSHARGDPPRPQHDHPRHPGRAVSGRGGGRAVRDHRVRGDGRQRAGLHQ